MSVGTYGQTGYKKTGKSCLQKQVRYKNKSIGTDTLTSIIEYMSYCLHIVTSVTGILVLKILVCRTNIFARKYSPPL